MERGLSNSISPLLSATVLEQGWSCTKPSIFKQLNASQKIKIMKLKVSRSQNNRFHIINVTIHWLWVRLPSTGIRKSVSTVGRSLKVYEMIAPACLGSPVRFWKLYCNRVIIRTLRNILGSCKTTDMRINDCTLTVKFSWTNGLGLEPTPADLVCTLVFDRWPHWGMTCWLSESVFARACMHTRMW